MSAAAWRIRKRVKNMIDAAQQEVSDIDDSPVYGGSLALAVTKREAYQRVLEVIDEEIEREAEHQFTRPITSTASFTVLDK